MGMCHKSTRTQFFNSSMFSSCRVFSSIRMQLATSHRTPSHLSSLPTGGLWQAPTVTSNHYTSLVKHICRRNVTRRMIRLVRSVKEVPASRVRHHTLLTPTFSVAPEPTCSPRAVASPAVFASDIWSLRCSSMIRSHEPRCVNPDGTVLVKISFYAAPPNSRRFYAPKNAPYFLAHFPKLVPPTRSSYIAMFLPTTRASSCLTSRQKEAAIGSLCWRSFSYWTPC